MKIQSLLLLLIILIFWGCSGSTNSPNISFQGHWDATAIYGDTIATYSFSIDLGQSANNIAGTGTYTKIVNNKTNKTNITPAGSVIDGNTLQLILLESQLLYYSGTINDAQTAITGTLQIDSTAKVNMIFYKK